MQDGAFPKTRKYTSMGPSLFLVAGAGRTKVKTKTSTRPHIDIYSGVYISELPLDDLEGISVGSSRSNAGTDSVSTSPVSHPIGFAWNLFGGIKVDDEECKATKRHNTANVDHRLLPAEDFEAPMAANSLGWRLVSPPRLEKGPGSRSTEFGGEVDKAGYAVNIPERSDSTSPSLPTTARTAVVFPILTPALANCHRHHHFS